MGNLLVPEINITEYQIAALEEISTMVLNLSFTNCDLLRRAGIVNIKQLLALTPAQIMEVGVDGARKSRDLELKLQDFLEKSFDINVPRS